MNTQLSKLNTTTPRTRPQSIAETKIQKNLCDSLRSLRLCVKILLLVLTAPAMIHAATTNNISSLVQKGLFEEEANHNLDAAIQSYQSAVALHDKDRKLAATAIFRLGECARKQGKTNEAAAYYKRIVTEFADQPDLVKIATQYIGQPQQQPTPSNQSKENAALIAQLHSLSIETAHAEALWKHVSDLKKQKSNGTDELVKFFSTIEPDQILIDLVNKRAEATAALQKLNTQPAAEPTAEKTLQEILNTVSRQLADRAETLAWSIEQRYKMLKEQENALSARLNQPSANVQPKVKSAETLLSGEDQQIEIIKRTIKDSPDLINAISESTAKTYLQSAAAAGQLRVIEFLLANGANIDGADSQGATPLIIASSNGRKAAVELLLNKGAKVDAARKDGTTALYVAAEKGFKSVAEVLIAHHADLNAKSAEGTPLHAAATTGEFAVAELLLANGADVNAIGRLGETPLMVAVTQRSEPLQLVKLLLAYKADPNIPDDSGYTPLLSAASRGKVDSAKILLENGANVEAQLDPAKTPQRYGHGWQYSGFRPINFAIYNNNNKLLQLLLEHHANPNSTFTWITDQQTTTETTPLMMAIRSGDKSGLGKILLEHGADPNLHDKNGATALHYAVRYQNTNAVTLLLDHGADVNALDNHRQSPIFYAVNQPQPSTNIIAILIAHHADLNIADEYGHPPIYHVMGTTPGTPLGVVREQLLKAGANENFVRIKHISVRRNHQDSVIFTKGSNSWNNFTLLELISVIYGGNNPPRTPGLADGYVSPPPGQMPVPGIGTPSALGTFPSRSLKNSSGFVIPGGQQTGDFQFPDFAHIIIRRISPVPLTQLSGIFVTQQSSEGPERSYNVNIEPLLQSTNRGNDVHLDWGDIVEIPEQDHPVTAMWEGMSVGTQRNLMNLLARPFQIKVKGITTNLVLFPPMFTFRTTDMWRTNVRNLFDGATVPENSLVSSFGVTSVINNAKILRSSSDINHIKIIRGQGTDLRSLTVNLLQGDELWVDPGDTIEIPDRDSASLRGEQQ